MNGGGLRRSLACLVAFLLVGGVNAPRASAAGGDLSVDLPIVPAHYEGGWADVLAVSGDDILAAHEGTYRWSGDGGRTWEPFGLSGDLINIADCGFGWVSAGVTSTDCLADQETAYSVVTNAQVGSIWTPPSFDTVIHRLGTRLLVDEWSGGFDVVDLATTPATVTTLPGKGLRLTEDGALSYTSGDDLTDDRFTWTLVVTKTTPSGSTTLKEITGLVSEPYVSASRDSAPILAPTGRTHAVASAVVSPPCR